MNHGDSCNFSFAARFQLAEDSERLLDPLGSGGRIQAGGPHALLKIFFVADGSADVPAGAFAGAGWSGDWNRSRAELLRWTTRLSLRLL